MKSNEQGEYCRSGSAVIVIALGRFAKNRYINYLLYYFTFRSKRAFLEHIVTLHEHSEFSYAHTCHSLYVGVSSFRNLMGCIGTS